MRFGDVDAPTPPCSADPELWFSESEADKDKARGVCSTCPFQVACRELSDQPFELLDTVLPHAEFGVWAGVDKRPNVERLSPKQLQTRQRAEEISKYIADGLSTYAIEKKMGLGRSSVQHIIKNHLTTGD